MEKFVTGEVRARKYRNRRIGEFFKEIELSEKQSTGITKILREIKKNGLPNPEFETEESRVYLITTFKMRDGFKREKTMSESVSGEGKFVVRKIADKNLKPQGEALNGALNEALNDTLEKDDSLMHIINIISEKPNVTQREIAEILGLSRITVQRGIKKLTDEKRLIRVGSKKKGYWKFNS